MAKAYKATPKQRKVLQALASPEFRDLNQTDFCKQVGVSRSYYWHLMRDPDFVEAVRMECGAIALRYAPKIMSKFAQLGSQGKFEHGKFALQSIGIGKDTPIMIQQNYFNQDEEVIDQKLVDIFTKNKRKQEVTDI